MSEVDISRSMRTKSLRVSWWSRCLLTMASYVVATALVPNLLLILINSSGYLPYSDRPGPGWQIPHFPGTEEIRFFAGFAVLLLPTAALYGLIFAAAALLLGFSRLPVWIFRILGGITAFLASGLVMAGVGWLIAMSAVGVYTAAGCGAVWGVFIFPKLVPRMSYVFPLAVRVVLPIALCFGGTYWLIKPLLPDSTLTNAKIEVIRRDVSGTDLTHLDLSYLGASMAEQASSTGKYVPVGRMEFTTDSRNQLRLLLIIDDDRPVAHTFVLPRAGSAIYRQSRGQWREERREAKYSGIFLELIPQGSAGINLEVKGHCCSSMAQTFAPYR